MIAPDEQLALLGGLSPRTFLREHWQKKPRLIRQAIPAFASPISPEELAGLACDPEVESRLVMERGGPAPWTVRHGPFAESDFTCLAATHWTLLVQEMNKHLPEAADLLERFRFVPDWRIDDLMVSYAPEGGSVGPHVDAYDVFLLQAQGRRRWSIAGPEQAAGPTLPDIEINVLAAFEPEQEWVLEPGDMLYLPPGIPHHGVALEPCQTWSVGFRAPSHGDLLAALAAHIAQGGDLEQRYADPDLQVPAHPGLLDEAVLARVADTIRSLVQGADTALWLGRLVTENRAGLGPEPPARPLDSAGMAALLSATGEVHRSDYVRFAYVRRARGECVLFADGQDYPLSAGAAFLGPLLGNHRRIEPARLAPALSDANALAVLVSLYNEGCIYAGQP